MAVTFDPTLPGGNTPGRILVRGTNWLGDAVMTIPALLRLREKFPDAHITLLCPEKLSDLWLPIPKSSEPGLAQSAVDKTITFAPGENVFRVAKKLRAGKYDLALVLPNSPRSALETFFAGIPRRIGYSRAWRNLFLTQSIPARREAVKMAKRSLGEIHRLTDESEVSNTPAQPPPPLAHQIYEYLHLAAALGANPEPLAPRLIVSGQEVESAREKFGLKNGSQPVFGLNPGAEYGPAKRWPADKFAATAREIQRHTNCAWIIFGGKSDARLAAEITEELETSRVTVRNLAGQTSLRELMALLKLCRVLLTNDTGPMHVAAALGTPVVVPFGSTSPELTGPGLPGDPRHQLLKSDAPCSPCFLRQCPIDFRCLNEIRVERVVGAVLKVIR